MRGGSIETEGCACLMPILGRLSLIQVGTGGEKMKRLLIMGLILVAVT